MTKPGKGKKAVVLLSGGLDSATTLAIALDQGFEAHCLSFSYGQRHSIELEHARKVAESFGIKDHRIAEIDLRLFGGSALTDDNIAVPKNRIPELGTQNSEPKEPPPPVYGGRQEGGFLTSHAVDTAPLLISPRTRGEEVQSSPRIGGGGPGEVIPATYVPARNTIFLSFALAFCETIGAFDIFIGVNALDYSGYPDCRPDYIKTFEILANLATAAAVEGRGVYTINAPLITLSKADIIRQGKALNVNYALTLSCYDPTPEGEACGTCDSCKLRLKGFAEAGLKDPARYVAN